MANDGRAYSAGRETDSREEMNDNTTGFPDPVFHSFFPQDDTEMRTMNLEMFVSANLKDIQNVNESYGAFQQTIMASFVFNVADRLCLSHHTRFLALELLERFMMKHVALLYQTVRSSQCSEQQKHEDWIRMVQQVESHVHLRAMSCCQLASKFISTQEALQLSVTKAVLEDLGYSYSKDAIRNSEQSILQTLDYNISLLCSYDYVLAILEVLDYNTGGDNLPMSTYLNVSGKLLMMLYLKSDIIYTCVLHETTPNSTRIALRRVQADKLLAAVCVIATAAFVSDPHHAQLVRKELQRLSGISEREIMVFMNVLLMEIRMNG